MKRKKAKIRLIKCPVRVQAPDNDRSDEWMELILNMGYLIYEDPCDENLRIVTDKTMSYSDYRKSSLCKGSDEWFDEVYADRMDEELDFEWSC